MTKWPAMLPCIPLWRRGRDVSKGHGEEWWGHPVCASSFPAFSADLHKHHFTALWETHLKPTQEERRGWIAYKYMNISTDYEIFKRLNLKKGQQQRTVYNHYTYMEWLLAPARMWGVGLGVVWSCVHVNVHLHLVVQDLHKLLHGGQVTGL